MVDPALFEQFLRLGADERDYITLDEFRNEIAA